MRQCAIVRTGKHGAVGWEVFDWRVQVNAGHFAKQDRQIESDVVGDDRRWLMRLHVSSELLEDLTQRTPVGECVLGCDPVDFSGVIRNYETAWLNDVLNVF